MCSSAFPVYFLTPSVTVQRTRSFSGNSKMTFFQVTFFFATLLAFGCASEDFAWGEKSDNDISLLGGFIIPPGEPGESITYELKFPLPGKTNDKIIKAITLTANEGETVTLSAGGPGEKFALITLKSLVGKNINSSFTIWGEKTDEELSDEESNAEESADEKLLDEDLLEKELPEKEL